MEIKKPARYSPRRDLAEMGQRRLVAAALFEKGVPQADVARQLSVSRQAVHAWFTRWKKRGEKSLAVAGRAGRKPRLSALQLKRVEASLLKGPAAYGFNSELWSLPSIAELITRLTGVRYHSGHVWRIMQKLGWSAQMPPPEDQGKDKAIIQHWRNRTWPALKKKPVKPNNS